MDPAAKIIESILSEMFDKSDIVIVDNVIDVPIINIFGGFKDYGISIAVNNGKVTIFYMSLILTKLHVNDLRNAPLELKVFSVNLAIPTDPVTLIRNGLTKIINDVNTARAINSINSIVIKQAGISQQVSPSSPAC